MKSWFKSLLKIGGAAGDTFIKNPDSKKKYEFGKEVVNEVAGSEEKPKEPGNVKKDKPV